MSYVKKIMYTTQVHQPVSTHPELIGSSDSLTAVASSGQKGKLSNPETGEIKWDGDLPWFIKIIITVTQDKNWEDGSATLIYIKPDTIVKEVEVIKEVVKEVQVIKEVEIIKEVIVEKIVEVEAPKVPMMTKMKNWFK